MMTFMWLYELERKKKTALIFQLWKIRTLMAQEKIEQILTFVKISSHVQLVPTQIMELGEN